MIQMSENSFPTGMVWDIFKTILSVPHRSGKEHQLASVLADMARAKGLEVKFDSYGNLRIDRKAAPGFEELPAVIMQGHLDMVCEKAEGVEFDFDRDPIKAVVKDGFIYASGTTLGADNGIGAAMALAVLFDPEYQGRAVSGLFTLEEETGLVGAGKLTRDMLDGKYLLNLDCVKEGSFCIGCAGGARLEADFDIPYAPAPEGYSVEISVSGLPGGHSGECIDKKHGNALVILSKMLESSGVDVSDICCKNADNVIPSAARAQVVSSEPPEVLANLFCTMVEEFKKELASGINIEVNVTEVSGSETVWESSWRKAVVSAMANVPNGVLEFAPEFNVPRTSSNFASAVVENGVLKLRFSQRSLENALRAEATELIGGVFSALGANVSVSSEYSGWKPVADAHVNSVAGEVWEKLFGNKPVFEVIHAGLEAGIISKINPELELISLGPDMFAIHSSNEHLSIGSTDRIYRFLLEFIKAL